MVLQFELLSPPDENRILQSKAWRLILLQLGATQINRLIVSITVDGLKIDDETSVRLVNANHNQGRKFDESQLNSK